MGVTYRFDFVEDVVQSWFLEPLDFFLDKRHVIHKILQRQFDQVVAACWLAPGEAEHLAESVDSMD